MIDPLTPPDPKPNDDQAICENCEFIIDKNNIIETHKGDKGCTECISRCQWCGNAYYNHNMYGDPFFGKTCPSCLNGEEYTKALREEVLKNALRTYFDQTPHRQIERLIITIAKNEGFTDLSNEMKNDL